MNAVITGAAGGIGLATANLFWESGYKITSVDINNWPDSGAEWRFIQKDLSQGKFLIDYPVNVLVCSHGVGGRGRTWDRVLDINATGVYNAVESILPHLIDGGSVIFVASMTGPVVGNKGMEIANYAASKGAVVGYMRQLAVELAPRNIRVNAVCPGPVITPMTDGLKRDDPELYDEFFGRCLLPGYTMPRDVAEAILYLAEAGRVTGQTLVIDGGYSIW